MKTVGNRLFKNKELKVKLIKTINLVTYIFRIVFFKLTLINQLLNGNIITNLFKIGNNNKLMVKVCPKLTKHHFQINTFSKMKVKYAVQRGDNLTSVSANNYFIKLSLLK